MKVSQLKCPCCGEKIPFAVDFEESSAECVEGVIATFWCLPCGQYRRGDWMLDKDYYAPNVPRIRKIEETAR